jgi:hypothetical protein
VSLDFDGVNDSFDSSATLTLGNTVTFACWFNADTQSGNNMMMAHGSGQRMELMWEATASSKKLRWFTTWNSGVGAWNMTSGFGTLSGWKWVAVTYDANATTNNPIMYTFDGSTFSVLTVGSGLTQVNTPVGAIIADNLTLYHGNGGGAFFYDGKIGEATVWKRILSDAEVRAVFALGVNAMPDHFNYLPMDDGRVQNLGSSGTSFTISGAVAGENPPTRAAMRKG